VLNPDGVQWATYTLKPGTQRSFPGRTTAQVCYLDGRKPTYTPWRELPSGAFEFRRRDGTWGLYSKTFALTLDNTANGNAFQYRIDGQVGIVPARTSVELARTIPATVVEFNRGNSQIATRLLLAGTDHYAVRLDAESQGIDLFKAEDPVPDANVVQSDANPPISPGTKVDDLRSRYPVGDLHE
jgi:hypothetical protein